MSYGDKIQLQIQPHICTLYIYIYTLYKLLFTATCFPELHANHCRPSSFHKDVLLHLKLADNVQKHPKNYLDGLNDWTKMMIPQTVDTGGSQENVCVLQRWIFTPVSDPYWTLLGYAHWRCCFLDACKWGLRVCLKQEFSLSLNCEMQQQQGSSASAGLLPHSTQTTVVGCLPAWDLLLRSGLFTFARSPVSAYARWRDTVNMIESKQKQN